MKAPKDSNGAAGASSSPLAPAAPAEMRLVRVIIEVAPSGQCMLTREHSRDGGDRFLCDDLRDAFDCVLAAYRPDGTPRRQLGLPRVEEKR